MARVDDTSDWGTMKSILENFGKWTNRSDSHLHHAASVNQSMKDLLQRQRLDGLISEQDARELEYVGDLWTKFIVSLHCKLSGCEFSDRDVLTYLVELYSLKQISKEQLIETALQK